MEPISLSDFLSAIPPADFEKKHRLIIRTGEPQKLEQELRHLGNLAIHYLPLSKIIVVEGLAKHLKSMEQFGQSLSVYEDSRLFLASAGVILDAIGKRAIAQSARSPTGKGVVVALLDTGIQVNSQNLQGAVISSKNFTPEGEEDSVGHGTQIAGIIGGRGASAKRLHEGMAPGVQFIDAKIFSRDGTAYMSTALEALAWIETQAPHVILFGGVTAPRHSQPDPLSQACRDITPKCFVVAPAGNFGPESNTVGSPACDPTVFCVGALTAGGDPAFFSSRGPAPDGTLKPDCVMPGVGIASLSTRSGEEATSITGTSAAAAILAGLLALLLEVNKQMPRLEIRTALSRAAEDLDLPPRSQGRGIINGLVLAENFGLSLRPPAVLEDSVRTALLASILLGISVFTLFALVIWLW